MKLQNAKQDSILPCWHLLEGITSLDTAQIKNNLTVARLSLLCTLVQDFFFFFGGGGVLKVLKKKKIRN